ncbi:MAG: type II toxin-antitoxin system YafQ family toxin [Spirochaetales bacterium]|nr:type II toxin-antitoxin system YafQ family toxin [Spirochaetales bacterium]MBR5097978.1 type II toxin-antitoxin system YafQ family toxin [Spirochaetales bacterium]
MSLRVQWTSKFKKDYKLCESRGLDMNLIDKVIRTLAETGTLPKEYKDHKLTGQWEGFRECHIRPDWLLVYAIQNQVLTLTLVRTGSHSDLF